MDELFGLSMNVIMVVLLAIFLCSMAVVLWLAWRNRVMVKLGLRNIPRRRAQTVLIIIGIMLSTVIISAAFGVGDTINFSIRNEAVVTLGTIDEIVVSARAGGGDTFGSNPYIPYQRFLQLREQLAGVDLIDGLAPGIGEVAPAVNPRTSLSEGRMRVAGVDPASLQGFGGFSTLSGVALSLEGLAQDEALVNDRAAEELEAQVGDELHLFIAGGRLPFRVKGVVHRGGLAGDTATLIIPLQRAQEIFGRAGQINSIAVSNRGNEITGASLSDEVTRRLRVLFVDREVASWLKGLLDQEAALQALADRQRSLRGAVQSDMARLRTELQGQEVGNELVDLLADSRVAAEVLVALDRAGLGDMEREVSTLFASLSEFRVLDIKRQLLEQADEASSLVTTFFVILGLFSIMVGILLIFLIFVMLAAARRSEMGIARAVGARRGHLVQMFVFEGTAYALVSAAVGVVLGLAVSTLMVAIVNRIIGGFAEDFRFTRHFEVRSIVVAYCLGMVITLATVAFSAYRVSRMNVVTAIRGLPEALVPQGELPFMTRLGNVGRAVARPFQSALHAFTSLPRPKSSPYLPGAWPGALWAAIPPLWLAEVGAAALRFIWPYLRRGWLTFLLGALLTWLGIAGGEAAPFRIGVSLMVVGLGLMLRLLVSRRAMPPEIFGALTVASGLALLGHGAFEEQIVSLITGASLVVVGIAMIGPLALRRTGRGPGTADRLAHTFLGIILLAFWVLPFNTLRAVAGDLSAGIEMFFVAGISMVAAGVWVVMYNADLLLRALTFLTGRVGKLRPVVVTAVAYPMSARFRTGLTLAMFALVIFTLIVTSILTEAFGTVSEDAATVAGGWDIEGRVNFNTPVGDMRRAIDGEPALDLEEFAAMGGYTTIPLEARQVGAQEQRWRRYAARAADDDFLAANGYRLKLIAQGYGPTEKDVWQALRNDPRLAVVDAQAVPSRVGFREDSVPFNLEGLHYEDSTMSPIDIEVREPLTGQVVKFTVIGVLDQLSDSFGNLGFGMFTSRASLDNALPLPVPITSYRFKVREGVDVERVSRSLEASFQEHGMETTVLATQVEEQAATRRAFNNLFTGFMGLGLMVGIAALGVVSLRAVVERRQQIGVLRAIGYRRRMIQLSFLLESSFVALLGTAIGVGLGAIISYNIVNDVRDNEGVTSLRFSIPWLQMGIIIGSAYIFSLLTTFLPARQAARIYPAEALRYE